MSFCPVLKVPLFALGGWCPKVSTGMPFWYIPNALCFQRLRRTFLKLTGFTAAPARVGLPLRYCRSKLRTNRTGFTLVTQYLHREESGSRSRWQDGGSKRDSHGDNSNPNAIEQTRMKRNVGHGINLGIERN